ncbi:thioesterase II family protein [Mycolicibacterium litorale]|uniref:Thioesterase TesA n=1 Tax=Mycolicibacterium litorale TaxID=758802 RepID=A0AAD1MU15_9MYCO|nr:alpha/beta fold hydrolase [Mycolicibacterium litorale]TDY00301.1 surfactin synthase thioesterase subunit [Mycolicibacterium litorale]BBY15867.1 putative thioesterase TesA [Mycolicibacterium litorale]
MTTSRPSEGTSPAPIDTLFIFPHAGGSAAEYKPFARGFTMDAKRIAVQYPGRADRHDVQDISSISALADEIHPMLAPSMVGARVAFFGHSMGGLIAFDIARRVEQAGGRIEALFVSASPAPGHGGYEQLRGSDAELLDMVATMTGTDSRFVGGQFGATVLKTLRSYGAITGYSCPPGTAVSCPIYAYAAADDAAVSYESICAWSDFTTGGFSVRTVSGDHFYITEHVSEVVTDIEQRIADRGGEPPERG